MGPWCRVGRIINRRSNFICMAPLFSWKQKQKGLLADCHHTILLLDSYHQDDGETTDCSVTAILGVPGEAEP